MRPELEEARVDGARTADVAGAEGDFGGGEDDVDVPLVAAPSVLTPGRSRLCRPPIALEPHATTRGAATAGGRRCAFAPGEARRSSRGLKKDDVSVCRGLVATIFSGTCVFRVKGVSRARARKMARTKHSKTCLRVITSSVSAATRASGLQA